MTIRDRWNRIIRKSVSSSSSGSNGSNGSTAAPSDLTAATNDATIVVTDTSVNNDGATGVTPQLTKTTSSRLAKTLTWRSNKSSEESATKKEAKKAAAPKRKLHPSERPLTETNLRHQELLSTFTMTFGRRKYSSGARTSFSGVSPNTSRPGSMDAGMAAPPLEFGHAEQRQRIASLDHDEPPQEQSGEEEGRT